MNIGDQVKVINLKNISNKNIRYGDIGRIITYQYDSLVGAVLGIEFDRFIDGHDCEGAGKKGFCSWIRINKVIATDESKPDIKKVSDYIVDIVCEESKNGNYIVDPLDVKGVISESEFIRYEAEIIEEINKNYKVAEAGEVSDNEIDVLVWLDYCKNYIQQ